MAFVLAYFAGVLTILSPCILPVLPFVFARAGQPFMKAGLPMLIGMALTFAAVASLAAVGGNWAVEANAWGRTAALVLLAGFGLLLLFPALSDRVTRPLVGLGARLADDADRRGASFGSSLLLGVATGLLWAPCAGPVLGLILTGAALNGATAGTTALLLAYALGAATSLALALLVGGRVFRAMKASLGLGEWLRRAAGAAVLVAVAAIWLGLDTGLLTRASLASTNALEDRLIARLMPEEAAPPVGAMAGSGAMTGGAMTGGAMTGGAMTGAMTGGAMTATTAMTGGAMTGTSAMTGGAMTGGAMTGGAMTGTTAMMAANPSMQGTTTAASLPPEGPMPPLDGAVQWLNGAPLTAEALKGKVVLVDFWTYSCINCLRAIPYVRAWAEKYRDQGLVVIGVHSPEFAFEKRISNVEKAIADLGITYPVAVDNDYAIWRAFQNRYWPAHYFIDATGQIRHHRFGEGGYDESERVIQELLAEAGKTVAGGIVEVKASGAEAASNAAEVGSPETYVGYLRTENFVGGDIVPDAPHSYMSLEPRLNEWGLEGDWIVGQEHAALAAEGGGITYRFHARDLHLVLGPGEDGRPVRFVVTIDGKPPGAAHGMDTDASGAGTISEQRLYQLIRQPGPIEDRTFEIRFLDPGVQAFAFTFG